MNNSGTKEVYLIKFSLFKKILIDREKNIDAKKYK
jgi:hypothetical protein